MMHGAAGQAAAGSVWAVWRCSAAACGGQQPGGPAEGPGTLLKWELLLYTAFLRDKINRRKNILLPRTARCSVCMLANQTSAAARDLAAAPIASAAASRDVLTACHPACCS